MVTTAYGTVVAGERIEETAPLIVTGYSTELHAADVVPMYYRPSGPIDGAIGSSSRATDTSYQGTSRQGQMQPDQPDDTDPYFTLALVGCLCSWIPMVGCVVACINDKAPNGTWKQTLSMTALCISSIVFILIVVYLYYRFFM